MPKIAIVTDSTADLPPELASRHKIEVVPALIVMDDKKLVDQKDISRSDFYEQMVNAKKTSTATPSLGAFQAVYQKLFQQGFQTVFSIHLAKKLSGIFDTAKSAAQAFGERICVLDSGSLSTGLGFQVLAAAEAAGKGFSAAKIIETVEELQKRLHLLAMLDTFEYIHRSGRVSWATARIGSLLQIKPFVEVKNGEVLSRGKTRTRRKGITQLKQMIEGFGPLERLAILHSNAEADAHALLESLDIQIDTSALTINVTPAIGVHVGPNGLGVAAVTAKSA
jgi:DegV family protein with EDD domain